MKKNPLFDDNFLNQLTLNRYREVYARITALTKDELPIEYIQGKVTGGSINIDGTSAVRRTCSLSMVAQDVNINDFYWGLKNKFRLEVGIKNNINPDYPDIIWFKQGIYIITSFSTSQSTNNFTISINGKDKMCLLNGDLSGVLPHSTDFGVEEIYDKATNTVTKNNIPIKNIIREAVQNFGGELPHNIIINDLEDSGLMLLEYRGNTPLYMFYDIEKGVYTNISTKGNLACYVKTENTYLGPYPIDGSEGFVRYYTPSDYGETDATIVVFESNKTYETRRHYYISKFEYGSIPGYRPTELTYPGELIANVGESLTSVLDKIRDMLGNFEYFYDVDGRFVFRKRPEYITTPWNSSETDTEIGMDASVAARSKIFNFTNGHLITSFANTPDLLNLRNDYSVWGQYKTLTGTEIPIHMRYAINKKPTSYQAIRPLKQHIVTRITDDKGWVTVTEEDKYFDAPDKQPYNNITMRSVTEKKVITSSEVQEITSYYATQPFTSDKYDWRELIYQMALDYRKYYHDDDFMYKLKKSNPDCSYGRTGYETYYTDIEGFWRQLYNPNPEMALDVIDPKDIKDSKGLYVYGFRKLTEAEKVSAMPTDMHRYYIIYQDTLYPFKKGCFLTQGVTYYILDSDGQLKTQTNNIEELKDISLDSIYILKGTNQNGEKIYSPFLENCFLTAKERNQLYIMEDELLYSDMIKDAALASVFNNYPSKIKYKYLDNYGIEKSKNELEINIIYYKEVYDYIMKNDDEEDPLNLYWKVDLLNNPESLIFWFDFLDAEGTELAKYSVPAIGTRSKAINDSSVKSIYYRTIPTVIFVTDDNFDKYEPKTGYIYAQLPKYMDNLFVASSKGKSAKEAIDELLYDHLLCAESASISSIPVYHLEPNGKIYIHDEKSGVDGEYSINKLTLPLAFNGTMSLTAIKATPGDMLIF